MVPPNGAPPVAKATELIVSVPVSLFALRVQTPTGNVMLYVPSQKMYVFASYIRSYNSVTEKILMPYSLNLVKSAREQ